MKILQRQDQQNSFKELVEIIKVLAKVEGEEATDAIISAFNIAKTIGVHKDLERLTAKESNENEYKKWTDTFCMNLVVRSIRK